MIDPSTLIDSLVMLLRDIPDLVMEMSGDPDRIYAYHDQYPKQASLALAIHQMPTPGILAAWKGSGPGLFGGVDVWQHRLTLHLRARETFEGDPPTSYYRLYRLIVKGVPASVGVPMLQATVHPSLYPMDPPSIERETDAEGLDYFEMHLTFTEIGDD
jgi:hypothetical protein